jgi:16S rRNA (adenine1518-N6/adenine1519-N6)-dimethyltransferase
MSEIKKILEKYGFLFKKQLGQNFITDLNLLESVVRDSGIDENSTVIEIGAGAGTLTRMLSLKASRVFTYEIDKALIPVLSEVLEGRANVTVINKDTMEVTDAEIREITEDKPFHVVANLPYYVTSSVIMKFIESGLPVESITVMVQKEVADRLAARENTPEYGAITVSVGVVSDVKITRNVSRKLFYPEPAVDSAIVRMNINRNKFPITNITLTRKVIRSAFSMRRKTLINNLMQGLNVSRETCEKILTKLNIDIRIRGEALSIEQFYTLGEEIGKLC